MSRLLALTVLCGMCSSVFSDADLKDCIFDFETFEPEADSEDLILDATGLSISTLTEGAKTYRYLTGEYKTRSKVDSSIQATYSITKRGDGIVDFDTLDICDFSAKNFQQYFKPFAGMHTDIPPNTTQCDRGPGTIHFFPVESSKDLVAGSKLDEGNYFFGVVFLKNRKVVGSLKSEFNVIRV